MIFEGMRAVFPSPASAGEVAVGWRAAIEGDRLCWFTSGHAGDGYRHAASCATIVAMQPREFYNQVVAKNIDDFHADYASERFAFNAIASVDALAAHLWSWCVANAPAEAGLGDDTAYRAMLAGRHPDFGLLRDVAKAQKHVRLTRGNPKVNNASQAVSRGVGFGEGGFGLGRFGGPEQVVVDDNNGDMHYVEHLVDDVVEFLLAEMNRVGVP